MAESNLIEVLIVGVDQASKQLAEVQTRLAGLEKSAGTASKSSEVLTTSWKGLGSATDTINKGLAELQTVAQALGVQGFTPLAATASSVTEGFNAMIAGAGSLVTTLGAVGVALGAASVASITLAKHFSELGMEINRAHQQTGLSVEDLSALKVAAEGVDVDFRNIEFSLRMFSRTLGQAAAGSREARDTFADLKISEDQVAAGLRDPGPLLELTAKRIMALQSVAQQTEVQFRLFGRGGREMTLVLQELADKGLDAARKKAEELGLLWNDKMVASAKRFNDSVNSISERLKGFVIFLGNEVLPTVQNFLDFWGKLAGLQIPKLPTIPEDQLKNFQTMLEREQKILALMREGKTQRALFPGEEGKLSVVPLPGNIDEQQRKVAALSTAIDKLRANAAKPVEAAVEIKPVVTTAQQRALDEIKTKMAADADKAAADIEAARQKAIFEQTGSRAALEASFKAQIGGITRAADAALTAELTKLKDSIPGLPAADEQAIRAAANRQRDAQIAQVQLERTRALFQLREQGNTTDLAQLKAQEDQAKSLLDVEQSRLEVLKAQQAPIGEQDAQLAKVQDAQERLLRVQIANREQQLRLIDDQISREGKVGDAARALRIQQEGITAELGKQRAELTNLDQQRNTAKILQDRKNLIATVQQELDIEKELEAARGKRAVDVQQQEISLRKQIKDLEKDAALAGITDETQRQIAEVNFKYQEQRDAISELIQLYPELESAALKALDAINNANKTAVDNINTNKNALVQMAQSLSDVFVNSMDRAFDEVLSSTDDFGKRMGNFMDDLGKTILKTILHSLITAPIKESLDTSITQLRKSVTGGGGLLAALFGGAGAGSMPGVGAEVIGGVAAAKQNLPVPDFSNWTFTIDKGMTDVSKTMTDGLSDLLGKSAEGFGTFFTSLASLVSNALSALSKGGSSMFSSILSIFSSVASVTGSLSGSSFAYSMPAAGDTGFPTVTPYTPPSFSTSNMAVPQSFLKQSAVATQAATSSANQAAMKQQQQPVAVIVNGNIAPNPPNLTPDQVIKIVYNDADRGGVTSKAITSVIKRTR